MDKLKHYWSTYIKNFIYCLLGALGYSFIQMMISLPMILTRLTKTQTLEGTNTFTLYLGITIIIILTSWLIWRFYKKKNHILKNMTPSYNEEDFWKESIIKGFKWALLLIGLFSVTQLTLIHVINIEVTTQSNQESLARQMTNNIPLFVIIAGVFIPILEEITYRHFLNKAFKFHWIGYITSAIIFWGAHSPEGVTGIILYGLISGVFTIAHIHTKNIIVTTTAHITYNTITVLFMIIQLYFMS